MTNVESQQKKKALFSIENCIVQHTKQKLCVMLIKQNRD